MEENNTLTNVFGLIITFSFISIVIVFVSVLMLGTLNNYAVYTLYNESVDMVASGVVESRFLPIILTVETGMSVLFPYLDYLWLISFITMAFSSVMFSYFSKRQNYFSIFAFAVFGMIIFTYVGGIFIQLTDWFKDNLLYAVFPSLVDNFPFFSWYLDNLSIINIILISVCIVANFVDIDLSKFNKRKGDETLDEI